MLTVLRISIDDGWKMAYMEIKTILIESRCLEGLSLPLYLRKKKKMYHESNQHITWVKTTGPFKPVIRDEIEYEKLMGFTGDTSVF